MYWRAADWPSALRWGSGDAAATAVAARNSRLSIDTSSKIVNNGLTTRRQTPHRHGQYADLRRVPRTGSVTIQLDRQLAQFPSPLICRASLRVSQLLPHRRDSTGCEAT